MKDKDENKTRSAQIKVENDTDVKNNVVRPEKDSEDVKMSEVNMNCE